MRLRVKMLAMLGVGLLLPGWGKQGELTARNGEYALPKIDLEKLYDLQWRTRDQEYWLEGGPKELELGPYLSARSPKESAAMVARARGMETGELVGRAVSPATLDDRINASAQIAQRSRMLREGDGLLEAIYQWLFTLRDKGFGKETQVYFLANGDLGDDAPPEVVARLQRSEVVTQDKVTVLPLSRAIQVSREGIRDRRTGQYGAIFRVDAIRSLPDGSVNVVASFAERSGYFFTRELVMRPDNDGWTVLSDKDYVVR